jgi:hypothetical protein
MKNLAVAYFFIFWGMTLLDNLVYWITHNYQAYILSGCYSFTVLFFWIVGTIIIWNIK